MASHIMGDGGIFWVGTIWFLYTMVGLFALAIIAWLIRERLKKK